MSLTQANRIVGHMESTRTVRITVRGRLSERLAAAFDGMTPVRRCGATELAGQVATKRSCTACSRASATSVSSSSP